MYKISDVSQLTGLSTHTLRYYEEIGLLPAVNKNCSGIREYSDEDVAFIEFVKDLKEMGLSLEEIIHFGKEGCVDENSALTVNDQLFSVLTKRLAGCCWFCAAASFYYNVNRKFFRRETI
ncbi:MerR family transcriptional regulator [Paenibacillus apii]|uniref:MerR family transcriptional regulator n=1 Tax=Paenibacillus apii TaxID=1850370 RepID=UPI001439E30D|nr:MerR family transcriptional regulator [Paenibacillus apii]NJJ39169.1 MerR family transcriptional regulator [Paenibacillus apii]